MAVKKKNSFITDDLEWAKEQLAAWKAYIDANPLHKLKDRKDMKETKNGGTIYQVVSRIEDQGKYIQETMKNYLALLAVVEELEQKEEVKKNAVRGDQALSPLEDGTI